ncbi:hypothetical protein [Mesorhizobium sp. M2C.T.Ca.TU.002.02.1.1]|uniref:hypothetical protein n=1 Tax=Mesorhizobium sp. M2C.T.Ca.TU.002.02.1.1 TaxID=2496788 RepID=UPI000FCA5188|nr:hypothetical protein [Mesorhizobium sp. M2C.T.Ca.TU.002.02.1.1]RUU55386.1 hypothetical protein EOD07_18880 [Mesorhizobium sp. M2C.T.Ca.TU.002.02.1.1]RUU68673.1 hypothetical protein EOD04_13360 [Mesorhizobium sp. M2C.T.Ca.TU.009.01.2.1]
MLGQAYHWRYIRLLALDLSDGSVKLGFRVLVDFWRTRLLPATPTHPPLTAGLSDNKAAVVYENVPMHVLLAFAVELHKHP